MRAEFSDHSFASIARMLFPKARASQKIVSARAID
jgi:hypothetical protein